MNGIQNLECMTKAEADLVELCTIQCTTRNFRWWSRKRTRQKLIREGKLGRHPNLLDAILMNENVKGLPLTKRARREDENIFLAEQMFSVCQKRSFRSSSKTVQHSWKRLALVSFRNCAGSYKAFDSQSQFQLSLRFKILESCFRLERLQNFC